MHSWYLYLTANQCLFAKWWKSEVVNSADEEKDLFLRFFYKDWQTEAVIVMNGLQFLVEIRFERALHFAT